MPGPGFHRAAQRRARRRSAARAKPVVPLGLAGCLLAGVARSQQTLPRAVRTRVLVRVRSRKRGRSAIARNSRKQAVGELNLFCSLGLHEWRAGCAADNLVAEAAYRNDL